MTQDIFQKSKRIDDKEIEFVDNKLNVDTKGKSLLMKIIHV